VRCGQKNSCKNGEGRILLPFVPRIDVTADIEVIGVGGQGSVQGLSKDIPLEG